MPHTHTALSESWHLKGTAVMSVMVRGVVGLCKGHSLLWKISKAQMNLQYFQGNAVSSRPSIILPYTSVCIDLSQQTMAPRSKRASHLFLPHNWFWIVHH